MCVIEAGCYGFAGLVAWFRCSGSACRLIPDLLEPAVPYQPDRGRPGSAVQELHVVSPRVQVAESLNDNTR